MVRVLTVVKSRYAANRLLNSARCQIFLIHILPAKGITPFQNEWELYFMFSSEKHDFSRGTLIFSKSPFLFVAVLEVPGSPFFLIKTCP
jgi:hypothetical protein